MIVNNEGSLVDSVEVVRDEDRLFLVDAEDLHRLGVDSPRSSKHVNGD